MGLNSEQIQRAHGMLLAKAAGDALGAGYEFGDPMPDSAAVDMIGGGPFGFDPYEWTDDTSMSIVVAQALLQSTVRRLDETACDAAVAGWSAWSRVAKDVGAQTSNVLSAARASAATGTPTAQDARNAAADLHRRSGRSGGNGSLMRTAPLALAYLERPENELFDAAFALSALTHFDPEAGEACALWCLALRHAILTGELDVRIGLPLLAPERQLAWTELVATAEASTPADFTNNGWVVEAFQAAWCSIATTETTDQTGPEHLKLALETAVRGGRDTDTVAAIAGALLGAAHGKTAVPDGWLGRLHGWPGYTVDDLLELSTQLIAGR